MVLIFIFISQYQSFKKFPEKTFEKRSSICLAQKADLSVGQLFSFVVAGYID